MNEIQVAAVQQIVDALRCLQSALRPDASRNYPAALPSHFDVHAAWEVLAGALHAAQDVLEWRNPEHGLASLYWREIAQRSEAIQGWLPRHDHDWAQLVGDEEDGPAVRDLAVVGQHAGLYLIRTRLRQSKSVRGLLVPESSALDRLRKLADEFELDFSAAPPRPGGGFVRRAATDAWCSWEKQQQAYVHRGGELVLEAIDRCEVAVQRVQSGELGIKVLPQLALDRPEQGLVQALGVATTPDGLRELVHWLNGPFTVENLWINLEQHEKGPDHLTERRQASRDFEESEQLAEDRLRRQDAHNRLLDRPDVRRITAIIEASGKDMASEAVKELGAQYAFDAKIDLAEVDKLTLDEFMKAMQGTAELVGPASYPTPETYARDKWIFENIEGHDCHSLKEKCAEYGRHRKWQKISSRNGLKNAADRYADFIGLSRRRFPDRRTPADG